MVTTDFRIMVLGGNVEEITECKEGYCLRSGNMERQRHLKLFLRNQKMEGTQVLFRNELRRGSQKDKKALLYKLKKVHLSHCSEVASCLGVFSSFPVLF